ncbi:vacuolar protein sorting-associated protein 4B-like isoform X1 [Branchiostoma floridae]|uniref:Vacuolar protein sorting-associated protein 4B-like isoform X1 n=3 Tax=Branchiostoma floridae TaxID=7739 RepID=A0A9J7KWB2_BRAFL|nr:vacuolar protein sorting-associated protein 4B-like isoform X1 [Branchiostoma floridae]
MTFCPIMDLLELYKEAAEWLIEAANECQKTANVDIDLLVENCERCSAMITRIRKKETDPIRNAALSELLRSMDYQMQILHTKQKQLTSTRLVPDGHSTQPCRADTPVTKKQPDDRRTSRRISIEDAIVPKGSLRFQDVAGLEEAKQALREAIILPLQYPHLFTGARKPWRRILLYGPPGTGKSRLAHALSSEIDSTFYCVSSSDLISSWVGESEKLIKELFQQAAYRKGTSVIFIDEIDSICRKRTSREEEHTRRVKTELLRQMEGADTSALSEKIFLMCATNCPWELDSAFLRRFQRRIYVPLPDREARKSLLQIHTSQNRVQLTELEWGQLADRTQGYSGSDIATVILAALFEPIRDLQLATHWRQTTGDQWTPCDSQDVGAVKGRLGEMPSDQVVPRDVCLQDFVKSLAAAHNTVSQGELQKFHDFSSSLG